MAKLDEGMILLWRGVSTIDQLKYRPVWDSDKKKFKEWLEKRESGTK